MRQTHASMLELPMSLNIVFVFGFLCWNIQMKKKKRSIQVFGSSFAIYYQLWLLFIQHNSRTAENDMARLTQLDIE